MLQFSVDANRCNHCGLCVSDCPPRIIEMNADRRPFVAAENEANCMECQHCFAVCPTGAISIFGLNPDDSLPVSPDCWPSLDAMTHLLRGRRSVRHYRDQNVEPALLSQLLDTVANGPTGVNVRSLTFTVIDDKAKMSRLREKVMAALIDIQKAGRIPPRLSYIEHAITGYAEHGVDVIFRGAPHVLIVSAPPTSPCKTEDVPIALSYFELLAQSAGLGTVWCGLLKLAFEAVPSLKSLVNLPSDCHYYPMLFGYPAIHFARTVQRDRAATIRRPEIGDEL